MKCLLEYNFFKDILFAAYIFKNFLNQTECIYFYEIKYCLFVKTCD